MLWNGSLFSDCRWNCWLWNCWPFGDFLALGLAVSGCGNLVSGLEQQGPEDDDGLDDEYENGFELLHGGDAVCAEFCNTFQCDNVVDLGERLGSLAGEVRSI
jgi:hypothetical protein